MTEARIRKILEELAAGRKSVEQALGRLRHLPFEDLGFARLDQHRSLRRGVPEVIFGEGKTAEQIAAIGARMLRSGANLLVTRLDAAKARSVRRRLGRLRYYPQARLGTVTAEAVRLTGQGTVVVISAGTSDVAVAEEAALSARFLGNRVERLYDVGVAGIHRLTASLPALEQASVVIVVAGMEGALPSVVAGLIDQPVIAVPTSVGDGAALGGMAALLAMLNSCASGVTVVNIDNGFGAALAATLINRVGLRRPGRAAR